MNRTINMIALLAYRAATKYDTSTSRQAFLDFSKPRSKDEISPKAIQQEGIKKCWMIKPHMSVTCMELVYFIKAYDIEGFPSRNYEVVYQQVHKRMREVERLGWIKQVGKRICTKKCSKCFTWEAGHKIKEFLRQADYIEREEASAMLDAGDKMFEGRD